MPKVEKVQRWAENAVEFIDKQNLVAIVEKGGNILSIGTNDMARTHPSYYENGYDRGIHAEYDALRKADCSGANLYVFYFKKEGGLGNSKPCRKCYNQIRDSGISRVFYVEDGDVICEKI